MFGFSISGMTLHFNYCCGELSSVEITPSENCDGMMGDKACCSEFELQASVDDATHFKPFELLKFVGEKHEPNEFLLVPDDVILLQQYYSTPHKVPLQKYPLYLLKREWLI